MSFLCEIRKDVGRNKSEKGIKVDDDVKKVKR
jgi:hypothetical protein